MHILHLDKNHPLLLSQLAKAGFSNTEEYTATMEEVKKMIGGYAGLVIRSRFKIDKQFIDEATNLRFIARVGAGLESIDTEYAESKKIKLYSAPEGNRNAVGEHALGMLLSLLNNLNRADRQVKSGVWEREANRGVEIEGKTIGIIGYGNMGKAFARKLSGFDCEVIFHDILDGLEDSYANQVSLEEIQKRATVLSLHTPWTPLTDKMVDATFIDKFKNPFWLINTARGKSVVTKDLVKALKNGQVIGAGLDVLEYEKGSFESLFTSEGIPSELNELLAMENVLLSPHIAGWTVESKEKLAQTIVDKILNDFNT